ncbi:TlpA disulfide reductase family protein [Mesorhizobium tamadayense]|uniref:TlpA disulfide reductase family protein n=1 Tax=Mesorhizobium tamadayense TaxID=425306 RepID=UPI00267C76C6
MVLQMEPAGSSIKVEIWSPGEPLTSFQDGIHEFWATWCGTCVAAMPHLVQLHQKYKNSGLGSSESQQTK